MSGVYLPHPDVLTAYDADDDIITKVKLGQTFEVQALDYYDGVCGLWTVQLVESTGTLTRHQFMKFHEQDDTGDGETVTAGTASTTTASGASWTVNGHVGKWAICTDASGAGTLAVGDSAYIIQNTATVLTHGNKLFSNTPTSNDKIVIWNPYSVEQGAAAGTGVGAAHPAGIALAAATAGQRFFVLKRGVYPDAIIANTAMVEGDGLIMGASGVLDKHTGGADEVVVGFVPYDGTVNGTGLVYINVP